MSEIAPFFAVPFAFAQNKDCAALHSDLRRHFESQVASGLQSADTRVYESKPDLFASQESCVRSLRDFCLRELLSVVCTLNGFDEATARGLVLQQSAWFRIVTRGGFLSIHNHPNSSWSGIYCIDEGHSDSDKPESGAISFLSPSIANGMFADAANTNLVESFAPHPRLVRLTAGQLVLFPSAVLHQVLPYEGVGARITVSFCCTFARPHTAAAGLRRSNR